MPGESGERSENVAARGEPPGVRNLTGLPRGSHAATDGEEGTCWGESWWGSDGASDNGPRQKGSSGVHESFRGQFGDFTFLPKTAARGCSRDNGPAFAKGAGYQHSVISGQQRSEDKIR